MEHHIQHSWELQPKDAIALQKALCSKVIRASDLSISQINTVAGIDTHFEQGSAKAAVAVLDLTTLETIETAVAWKRVNYSYVPGLLSFREGPVVLDALQKIKHAPEVLLFDGQGIAHPRRFGLASHIGLWLDLPSIGCAKTRLSGRYAEPDSEKGSYSYLREDGETIGAVVRTRKNVRPVFVSIGHRMNLQDSIRIVLKCCRRYRLPEPTRRADQLARSWFIG